MSLLNWMDKNLERVIGGAMLATIVALITANVFMRYVLNSSLSWGEELTLWIFVWFIWIAVSLAFKRGQHIRITFLFDLLSPRGQKATQILVSVLILAFFGLLSWECINLMLKPFVASQTSVVLGLPIPVLYASAPVGALLSSFRVIQHLIVVLQTPTATPSEGI